MGKELREKDAEIFTAVVEKLQDIEKHDILYASCLGDSKCHVS